jgi:hypothetical protein
MDHTDKGPPRSGGGGQSPRRQIYFALIAIMASVLLMGIAASLPGVTPRASAQVVLPEVPSYICHRTASASMPYVQNSPASSGVAMGHYQQHQGPIATSPSVAQDLKDNHIEWGDIIPPFEALPAGYNWTATGEAMWENGCDFATTPPSATLTIVRSAWARKTVRTSPSPFLMAWK